MRRPNFSPCKGDELITSSWQFALQEALRRSIVRHSRQVVRAAPQRGWWLVQDVR